MRGLNTEIGHEVVARSGLLRGPGCHQLLTEFFPVRGFSQSAGNWEDAAVEDCIQQHHLIYEKESRVGILVFGTKLEKGEVVSYLRFPRAR
jgi:hypothetical protein